MHPENKRLCDHCRRDRWSDLKHRVALGESLQKAGRHWNISRQRVQKIITGAEPPWPRWCVGCSDEPVDNENGGPGTPAANGTL